MNDIISYFNKYQRNLLFLICSSYPLNNSQIFKILGAVKENEVLFKNIKKILRENKNIKGIIEKCKNDFYSQDEINYYNTHSKIKDKSFYKNKEFIDSIDFKKYSTNFECDALVNWDVEYLMMKFNKKFLDLIVINKNFKWSISLLEKYQKQLTVYNWRELSARGDIEWSLDLLIKYRNNWEWDVISKNESIPFSEEIVMQFKDKWNERYVYGNLWQYLFKNNSVQWSYKLLMFYLSEKEQNFKYLFDYDGLDLFCQNKSVLWSYNLLDIDYSYHKKDCCIAPFLSINIPWTNSIIETYKDKINWTRFSSRSDVKWNEVLYSFTYYIDWKELSKNESVNWSIYSIIKYENLIDFKILSANPKVEWSKTLLNRYKEKFDWSLLALNKGICWNSNLISEFRDKISFYSLTKSMTVEWTTDILLEYKDYWDLYCDYFIGKRCNDCLYEEEFFTPEICNNKNVIFTIDFILEKLKMWEKHWSEFVLETRRKITPIELNGNIYDKNNPIWKRLSENNNLYKELIIYFKELWDIDMLIKNENIMWDFDLIKHFDKKLDSSTSNYYLEKFWTSCLDNNYFNQEEIVDIEKILVFNLIDNI